MKQKNVQTTFRVPPIKKKPLDKKEMIRLAARVKVYLEQEQEYLEQEQRKNNYNNGRQFF
jgi:hypothetical protein